MSDGDLSTLTDPGAESPQGRQGRKKRPTLRDVGARAGVSYRTVSRVINGDRFVAPATADAVHRAAAELGFQRNDIARSLRQGDRTLTIGLVVEDLANPFYGRFGQQVAAEALRHGYVVLTASGEHDPRTERDVVTAFLRRRVDGLIVFPASDDHRYLRAELDRGTSMVFADAEAGGLETDVVAVDNRGGARTAVAHLIAHGHSRIAILAESDRLQVARERLAGYSDALGAAGIASDDALVITGLRTAGDARVACAQLMSAGRTAPTAIFTANNRITVGTLTAMRDSGYRAALVGFGDFETAELLTPAVTVVRQDPAQMASAALRLLLERISGARTGGSTHIRLPVELVRRGSGEIAPDR